MREEITIRQIDPDFDEKEKKLLSEVITSGWVSEGPKTRQFEAMIASYIGVKYALAVPSGTIALTLACMGAGLEPGDEVLIPSLTMAGTVTSVILAGGRPVFVDIDPKTLCLDASLLERKINKRTKAIMPVHLNGRSSNMQAILQIAKKFDLFVIEDAAQAFSSMHRGKFLGTFGHIGCYSFSVPKIVTTGQGGMVVTNSEVLYKKMQKLKDFGRHAKGLDIHDTVGFNFKFTDLQAALGIEQMKKVSKHIRKKKKIFRKYQSLLKHLPRIQFLQTDLTQTVPWFIDIYTPDRDALVRYLLQKGIETRVMYPPMHTQLAFTSFSASTETFPYTQNAASAGLWLPSSVILSDAQVAFVCDTIKEFYHA